MRKLKLLMMTVCALMGAGQTWAAYTDYLTEGNGWTQVTDASGITTDGSCSYVIVASDYDLVVGIPAENSDAQLSYQTLSGQPARKQVWYIEADTYGSGGYALKNFARTGYYITSVYSDSDQGAWNLVARTTDKNTANTCYQFTFDGSGNLFIQTHGDVYSDTETESENGHWWGDWTVGNHSNGDGLAGNKTSDDKVTFKLYKKNEVSSLISNNDFSGDYSAITATPTAVNSDRKIYQPSGWDIAITNKSVYNMSVVKNGDPQQTSNFTGTYAPGTDGKYMVRFRDNQTTEYIDLSQSITFPYAGLYLLSSELIRENSAKATVKLYAGSQEVSNSKNGAWETRYLLLNVTAGQTVKIGIKFENKGAGGHKAGADNIQLKKLADAPVDVTELVANPTFDSNIDSWNTPIGSGKQANNKEGMTNFYESWNSTPKEGRMYQVLEGLPQGTYKLTMKAFTAQNGTMTPANTSVAIYAQGQEVGTTSSSYIHPNYVNSEDVQTYQTWAYVDATGKLEIGMRQYTPAEFRWLGMDDVTLQYVSSSDQEDALLLAELQSKWSAVKSAISTAASGTYSNVTGSEGTALTSALSTASGQSISAISDYATYAAPLNTAFINVINAKGNYDKFDVEKENALLMGVDENDVVRPASGSNDDLLTAMRGLYVLEDAAATSGYTIDATNIFGEWTEQNTGSNSGQHWSGDGRSYIDQNSGSGYTMSVTNTVTLPAGHYVFKAAARAAADGVNGAFNMSVKKGSADAVYKHYNAQGDSGKGIDTSGAVNYGDGTFCNDGAGRGWEWRLFAFDLNESTEVKMQVYAQILGGKWVSFSDIGLFTTEDNIGICEMMWDNALAAAEAARDNNDYNNVTGKERTDLLAAISAAETEPTTSAGYKEQETALINATNAFIAVKDTYDEYAQETVIAEELDVEVPDINSVSTTAATLISNMQTMNVSDYSAVTTNYTYDATALLGAWSNAPGTNHGQSWTGENGDSGYDTYYDSWNAAAFNMSQTVTLPKAKYVLIAKGRASTDGRLTLSDGTNTITFPHKGNDGKGIETDGTPNFGSGTYSNDGNGNGWEYRFLTFESDGSTPTTLTFNWTTASYNWAGLDDITLLAIPETVTIAEDDTEAPDYSIADVTLTRTLSASYWNTFSVPFDMDIPDGWTVKEFDSATDNVITFKNATTIEAGKPYLVKPTANVENPTYSSVIVQNTEGSTVGGGDYKFAAQIYNKTLATDGTIAYLATDGKVKKLTSGGGLKGLRAYFIIPKGAEARIAFLDDETTGITEMKQQSNSEEQVIYDLNGRRVQNMQKGIYIVNGKKIVK